jgi:hypothetical protein
MSVAELSAMIERYVPTEEGRGALRTFLESGIGGPASALASAGFEEISLAPSLAPANEDATSPRTARTPPCRASERSYS